MDAEETSAAPTPAELVPQELTLDHIEAQMQRLAWEEVTRGDTSVTGRSPRSEITAAVDQGHPGLLLLSSQVETRPAEALPLLVAVANRVMSEGFGARVCVRLGPPPSTAPDDQGQAAAPSVRAVVSCEHRVPLGVGVSSAHLVEILQWFEQERRRCSGRFTIVNLR